MKQITLRVQPEVKEALEGEASENGKTLSEYMRTLIDDRHDNGVDDSEYERLQAEYDRLQEEHDRLQSKHDDLQTEVERVRREKRQILEQREEHTELVKTVERERSLMERKQQAGIVTRAKWLLTGMPDE